MVLINTCRSLCRCAAVHTIDAGLQMHQIEALGISTQRGTFTTWDRLPKIIILERFKQKSYSDLFSLPSWPTLILWLFTLCFFFTLIGPQGILFITSSPGMTSELQTWWIPGTDPAQWKWVSSCLQFLHLCTVSISIPVRGEAKKQVRKQQRFQKQPW